MAIIGTAIELGRVIHDARTAQGLTQAELAAAAAVSRRWIIALERGHSNAQFSKVLVVLRTLGLALDTIPIPQRPAGADDLEDFVEGWVEP